MRSVHPGAGASLSVCLLAAVACTPGVAQKSEGTSTGEGLSARKVHVTQPVQVLPDRSYPSSLYVERDVNVAARASGVIASVLADRGARVRAGDALAVMDTEIARRDLEIAEQDARLAQAEYDRLAPLFDKQVVSEQDFVRAEIDRDQAVSKRELARTWLEHCTVRAPFDGVVVERWAVAGQHVQEEDAVPLFRVVADEPLRARVDIPEVRLDSLKVGSPAWVGDLDGDETHAARVVFVSPAIDAGSGTVPVIVQMREGEEHLRIGSSVRVRFEEDAGAVTGMVRIPRSALADVAAHDNVTTEVMVIVEGRARNRKVRVVETSGTTVVVEGPLTPDDQVILAGWDGVREGDPVSAEGAGL